MFQSIRSSTIAKNLSLLVSGTVLAQLLAVGFQVILRRVFSPAEFGAFAVYMSLVGILITVATFRYEQAIVLPKDKEKAVSLLKLTFVLAFLMALLCLLGIVIFKNDIIKWIGFPEIYSNWLYVLPLSIIVFSFAQSLNFFLIREKNFKLSATNKIYRRAGEGIIQTSFGFSGTSIGLVFGDIVGRAFMIIRSVLKISLSWKKSSVMDLRFAAKEYKDFPLKNGLPALFNTFSALLPILFINKLFNEEVTGFFDLARMVLIVPLSLVTASLSQVLLQNFSEKKNKRRSIKKDAIGTFLGLLIPAAAFGIIIFFGGETLFSWIFGKANEVAGDYASIIVWAFALKFIVSPFNMLFTAFEKIGVLSIWQIIYFLLILSLNWLSFSSIEEFLKAYLIIELVSYSLIGFLNVGLIINYENSLRKVYT